MDVVCYTSILINERIIMNYIGAMRYSDKCKIPETLDTGVLAYSFGLKALFIGDTNKKPKLVCISPDIDVEKMVPPEILPEGEYWFSDESRCLFIGNTNNEPMFVRQVPEDESVEI